MISKKDFSEIIFLFPPQKNEQSSIANILSDMDAEIKQLEQKLSKYKFIKQGMMQELLTGKIRLV
jgi:type I restriction enzyme S subunit